MHGNLRLITLRIHHSKLAHCKHSKRTKVTKVAFDVRFRWAAMLEGGSTHGCVVQQNVARQPMATLIAL